MKVQKLALVPVLASFAVEHTNAQNAHMLRNGSRKMKAGGNTAYDNRTLVEGGVVGGDEYFEQQYIDTMFMVMTHNSLALPGKVLSPNQNYGLATQFKDGVRGFNLDLYEDEDSGNIYTEHGPGLWYDPNDEVKELINELEKKKHEFIIVQLQSALKTKGVEKVCGWWGDLLITNFDREKPLGKYIQKGKRVLMVTDGISNASIGMHKTEDFFVENNYDWSDRYGDPPLGYRRGPKPEDGKGRVGKMMSHFCCSGLGHMVASWFINDVGRTLSHIRMYEEQSYASNTLNIILVDYYEVGDSSIMQVKYVMQNAGSGGLQEGQSCIGHGDENDEQCSGTLECGKRTTSDKHENDYICCDQTYVPFGWTTDVCYGNLKEGESCPSTFDNDCAGSLKCGKRSAADEHENDYVCCDNVYTPIGWTTDVCSGSLKKGESCPSTQDNDCVGSLECGKRSESDEHYICCDETYVPFGWTTDVCKGSKGVGQACSGNSECTNGACGRATAALGTSLTCCASGAVGTYAGYDYCKRMPDGSTCWSDAQCDSGYCRGNNFGLSRGTCFRRLAEGRSCPSEKNADCAGSAGCYRTTRGGNYKCCSHQCFCDFWDAGCTTGFWYCSSSGLGC